MDRQVNNIIFLHRIKNLIVDETGLDETKVDETAVDEIAVDKPGPHRQNVRSVKPFFDSLSRMLTNRPLVQKAVELLSSAENTQVVR